MDEARGKKEQNINSQKTGVDSQKSSYLENLEINMRILLIWISKE
jgi:hypothetical protein